MLYTEEMVRGNIRCRDGKRVFFLGRGDQLTAGARDYLNRERIPILPGQEEKIQEYRLLNGAVLREKPENMTHLHGNILVNKTHPRIAFRGAMDSLEAQILCCQRVCGGALVKQLQEVLDLARRLIRCEVLNEPVGEMKLCGLTEEEQRARSHRPQDFFGQPHFMPQVADGERIVELNRCRCAARQAELTAAGAFTDADGNCCREDILKALNRMSSMIYILMCMVKSGKL